MTIRFCRKQHQLECVEFPTNTYACIECERLYQVIDGGVLMEVEYRPVHEKDPFWMAKEMRANRKRRAEQRTMWRNDQSIKALQARSW